jgi:hypothetical protein
MPKRTGHIRVGKLFLKELFDKVKRMKNVIMSKDLTPDNLNIVKKFNTRFNTNDKPKDFFMPFYKTRLMRSESLTITEHGKERTANYVSIFGYLRTLFLGVLSGDPRIGFLSRRIQKYKKTKDVTDIFEAFIRLYREVIGFKKISLPRHILASANVFSKCEQKPKNLCFPPTCEYIHHTRRSKGYCRTKKTRKKSRKGTT